jgi:23S rRNA pseudouridine1911/1915/1917 synthase
LSKKDSKGLNFSVGPGTDGLRIDKFLTEHIKNISRSQIQKIICKGKVEVNNIVVNKHYRIVENDEVLVKSLEGERQNPDIAPQKIKLKIVHEDDHLLVISKEPGMLTHPAQGSTKDTLVNALLYHYKDLSRVQGDERAGIVHRLDKDTSGLLIIAKNDDVHAKISDMFKSREVKKTYSALTAGLFGESKGKIMLPIGRSRIDRKKMGISIDQGREAVTLFEVAEEFRPKQCALLDVYPQTGRTHQIRVHLSYIGHPVVGDEVYGNKDSGSIAKDLGLKRQFLHARRLKFKHPVTGKDMDLEDDLFDDLKKCLKELRRQIKMDK